MKKPSLWELFLRMLKIGLFTFGGGYAMMGIIEDELVNKKKWLSYEEYLQMITISEATPGAIAINMATYIGFKKRKILGAIISTIGVVIPSFFIIILIAIFFNQFKQIKVVEAMFEGIKIGVLIIIILSGVKLFLKMKKNLFNYCFFFISLLIILVLNIFEFSISSLIYLLGAFIIGMMIDSIKRLRHKI